MLLSGYKGFLSGYKDFPGLELLMRYPSKIYITYIGQLCPNACLEAYFYVLSLRLIITLCYYPKYYYDSTNTLGNIRLNLTRDPHHCTLLKVKFQENKLASSWTQNRTWKKNAQIYINEICLLQICKIWNKFNSNIK